MPTVLDRRKQSVRGRRPDGPAAMPMTAGALLAVQAAAASLSVIMVPVVLAWATASFSEAPWTKALQFGVSAWLLAQHAGIVIPGGHIGLVPIGLLAIPLVCCWLAGVRLARNLDPNAADLRAGVGRAHPVMPPPRALAGLVAGYSALTGLVSVLATSGSVRPLGAQALAGAVLISGAGGVCGAAAWAGGGFVPGLALVLSWLRLPPWFTRLLRPLALAGAVQAGSGLLIVLAMFGFHGGRVLTLHHALHPGLLGGLVLVIAQLTMLPNLVIWATSVTAGPGFMVGTGTAIQAGHTSVGVLPAVPLLGALPSPGPHPAWVWGLLALPALSGVVLGLLIVRRDPSAGLRTVAADVARAAALTGVIWAFLGWLSGGPAGPGTLAHLGPVAWEFGLAMAGEVGAGALVGAGVLLAVWHFTPGPSDDQVIDLTD